MRQSGLRQKKHSENVGLERALQLVFGDVSKVLIMVLLAGIVDEDIEPSELIDCFLDRSLAELLISDIADDGDCPASLLLDDLLGLSSVFTLAQVQNSDVRALAGVQSCDRSTNAAIGAGDQRDLALEPVRSLVARFPLWFRLKLALKAWKPILVDHWLHQIGVIIHHRLLLESVTRTDASKRNLWLLSGGRELAYFLDLCSALPLRSVDAIFLSSFSLIEEAIDFDAPLSLLFGVSPRLAERAAPAAFCCAADFAGIF